MTIIEKIKQSVEGATDLVFLYHAAGEMNELITRAERLPVAFAFLLDSGTIEDVNGRYHERVTLAVMFTDKTQFDFNALENEEIIDRMKLKAYKWLESLRNSNDLQIVSVNSTQRLYDTTTDILTGYAVNITLQDMYGVGDCELPEVVIDMDKNGSYNVVGVDKVRVNVVPRLEELEVAQNGEYLPPTDIAGFSKVKVNVQPTLEELTVTANGEYLPQDGVDGFSRVVAEFDISILPKVKVENFQLNISCLDENGIWNNDFIDTSLVKNWVNKFASNFYKGFTSKLNVTSNTISVYGMFNNFGGEYVDVSDYDLRNVTDAQIMFSGAANIDNIDVRRWDVSNITKFWAIFNYCSKLTKLDLTNWDMRAATRVTSMFAHCPSLVSLIGGKTIDEVLNNDISCLNGLKVFERDVFSHTTNLDRASLRALINGLADLTGETTQTLTLGETLIAKLTEEDIAIATNKNWTIV